MPIESPTHCLTPWSKLKQLQDPWEGTKLTPTYYAYYANNMDESTQQVFKSICNRLVLPSCSLEAQMCGFLQTTCIIVHIVHWNVQGSFSNWEWLSKFMQSLDLRVYNLVMFGRSIINIITRCLEFVTLQGKHKTWLQPYDQNWLSVHASHVEPKWWLEVSLVIIWLGFLSYRPRLGWESCKERVGNIVLSMYYIFMVVITNHKTKIST